MKDVQAPPLTDPALVQTGFVRYQENCVTCHGEEHERLTLPALAESPNDWDPAFID